MNYHAAKTERGWEVADETGTFQDITSSPVFRTRAEAQAEARRWNQPERVVSHAEMLRPD